MFHRTQAMKLELQKKYSKLSLSIAFRLEYIQLDQLDQLILSPEVDYFRNI
jgi:hypothetical protein